MYLLKEENHMNINQIIEKFKSDTAFAEKYSALTGMDAILEQAKADGFDVTAEEIDAAIFQLGQKTGELSEADLAVVAGGKNPDDMSGCYFEPTSDKQRRAGVDRQRCGRSTCHEWFDNGWHLSRYHCACYGVLIASGNNGKICEDRWHVLLEGVSCINKK